SADGPGTHRRVAPPKRRPPPAGGRWPLPRRPRARTRGAPRRGQERSRACAGRQDRDDRGARADRCARGVDPWRSPRAEAAADLPDLRQPLAWGGAPGQRPYTRPVLASAARYVGEPIAAVVAATPERAADAAALIAVEYDLLPPVVSAEHGAATAARVHDWPD